MVIKYSFRCREFESGGLNRMEEALEKAIAKYGSARAFAIAIGVTPQAVSQWQKVPAGRVLAVEALTGIGRHELRPDIFGAKPAGEEVAA